MSQWGTAAQGLWWLRSRGPRDTIFSALGVITNLVETCVGGPTASMRSFLIPNPACVTMTDFATLLSTTIAAASPLSR
ncbi:hypothetical protein LY76DRAFT_596050 [Colletotrichum caudatum]|nr:hypothetical protein LY76DRAFT_596050 [Colletotrichum caudatum]